MTKGRWMRPLSVSIMLPLRLELSAALRMSAVAININGVARAFA